jgi:hypothetical protein
MSRFAPIRDGDEGMSFAGKVAPRKWRTARMGRPASYIGKCRASALALSPVTPQARASEAVQKAGGALSKIG